MLKPLLLNGLGGATPILWSSCLWSNVHMHFPSLFVLKEAGLISKLDPKWNQGPICYISDLLVDRILNECTFGNFGYDFSILVNVVGGSRFSTCSCWVTFFFAVVLNSHTTERKYDTLHTTACPKLPWLITCHPWIQVQIPSENHAWVKCKLLRLIFFVIIWATLLQKVWLFYFIDIFLHVTFLLWCTW